MLLSRNMIIYAAGKILPALSTIFVMWMGIRWLGAAGYGRYILIVNVVALVTSFTAGWLQQGILRYSGVNEAHPLRLGRAHYRHLLLISNSAAALIMGLVGLFYFHLDAITLLCSTLLALVFNAYLIQLSYIQSNQASTRFALTESIAALSGIVFIALAGFYYSPITLLIFVCGIALGYFASFAFNFHVNKQDQSNAGFGTVFSGLFRFGAPLTVWLFISSLFNMADRFMIEHYFQYEAVGTYSAVYDLIYKVSSFLSMPVLLAYHPSIAAAWNKSELDKAKRLIRTAILLECLLLIVMFLLFLFGSDILFGFLLQGVPLPEGGWYFALICSSMIWQISLLLHKPLELRLQLNKMLLGIALSLSLNVTLNYFLLPQYGYTMAAWTTLLCTLVYAGWVTTISHFSQSR